MAGAAQNSLSMDALGAIGHPHGCSQKSDPRSGHEAAADGTSIKYYWTIGGGDGGDAPAAGDPGEDSSQPNLLFSEDEKLGDPPGYDGGSGNSVIHTTCVQVSAAADPFPATGPESQVSSSTLGDSETSLELL